MNKAVVDRPIVLTGANGFLGRRIGVLLNGDGRTVTPMPREARLSVDAARIWLAEHRPAALVHTAGIVDVRYCQAHPLEAFEAHVAHTGHLLEALRADHPETPFVYVATDKSFGEQDDCGLQTPYRPVYPYNSSKACEDLLVESFGATYGLRTCLLRFPNFYGEGDIHHERLVPSVCLAVVNDDELVIRTRLDGSFRQYIYVGDAADIVRQVIERGRAGDPVPRRAHFGPRAIKSVGDVIADVEAISGKRIRVKVLNQPGESSRISLQDENGLGYRYTDWREGLSRTLRGYQAIKGR